MTAVTGASYWQEEGLTQRIAEALGQARIRDRDELAAMTREELLSLANLPEGAVRRCEELLWSRLILTEKDRRRLLKAGGAL